MHSCRAGDQWLPMHPSQRALCLQVLCALVSASPARQHWLWQAGLLPALQRLTLDRNDMWPVSSPAMQHVGCPALAHQHQHRAALSQSMSGATPFSLALQASTCSIVCVHIWAPCSAPRPGCPAPAANHVPSGLAPAGGTSTGDAPVHLCAAAVRQAAGHDDCHPRHAGTPVLLPRQPDSGNLLGLVMSGLPGCTLAPLVAAHAAGCAVDPADAALSGLLAGLTASLPVQPGPWEPWLRDLMDSPDAKLSSHAARAWLHLQAARAMPQQVRVTSLPSNHSSTAAAAGPSEPGHADSCVATRAAPASFCSLCVVGAIWQL